MRRVSWARVVFAAAVAAGVAAVVWRTWPSDPPVDPAAAAAGVAAADWLAALPEDRDALARGARLLDRGRYADAVRELNKIRRQDDGPVHLRAVVLTGRCLLAGGQLADAEKLFLYAADRRPDDADAHRGLAAVYYDLGSAADAERHARRVADLAPADRGSLRLLATQALDLQHYDVAEEALAALLARTPPAAEAAAARRDRAAALAGLKRYADALAAAPPAGDDPPAARAVRAESLRAVGRPDAAEREVAAGLAVDPDNARLWVERGLLAADRPDDASAAAAAAAFERAVAADPFNKTARYQAGLAYRRLGRDATAADHEAKFKDVDARLRRVAALNTDAVNRPWDAAVRRELAAACRQINRPDLAGHWDRAAAQCPPPK